MTITLAEAQHRLHTLIESQPTKVAGGTGMTCMYFGQDGQPSCIVGHAFPTELAEAGVEYGNSDNENSITGLVGDLLIDIEPLALDYLTIAQEQQDSGLTWASAVTIADSFLANVLADEIAEAVVVAEDGQLALVF